MVDMEITAAPFPEVTPIQSFYQFSSVLLTGATGFLGKALLEKLLRSCEVHTVYVLVRHRKGRRCQERVEELLDDPVFAKLRSERPKYEHRVVGIVGDVGVSGLGLSSGDREMLIREVSVIFHVAATVRFDERLKLATAINVCGVQEMIKLARQMKGLKSFMHVSTAYSQCPHAVIEERFYPLPFDSQKLISVVEGMPDKLLEHITPKILGKWPNTYAFTKAVAEDILKKQAQGLPIGVFRPSIVISSYREPLKAWITNLYGPTGVCAGAGTGLLRVLRCDSQVNANIVPVDLVVNALLAAGWEVGTNHLKNRKLEDDHMITRDCYNNNSYKQENLHQDEVKGTNKRWESSKNTSDVSGYGNVIPVYHYESSNDKPITWETYMDKTQRHGIDAPSVKAIWYYSLCLRASWLGYWFSVILLHYLPALIVDGAMLCIGKGPRMLKIYKKVHKFTNVISYFSTRNWTFKSGRIRQLLATMSERDKEIFFCDLRELDWEEYFEHYIRGIRLYLLQDPLETLPEARAKWRKLYWLHQTVKVLAGFFAIRICWWFLSTMFYVIFY